MVMSALVWIVIIALGSAGLGALLAALLVSVRHQRPREILLERATTAEAGAAEAANLRIELETCRAENTDLRLAAASLEARAQAEQDKSVWTEQAHQRLREAFQSLAAQALHTNANAFLTQTRTQMDSLLKQFQGDWSTQKEQFSGLVQPVEKSLKQLDEQVRRLEERREGAYQTLEQHLLELRGAYQGLRDETGRLHTALTTNASTRGRWGELQLRRIVEMSGLLDRVDFEEQPSVGEQRPDMIINIPNGGILPVDAKTSMEDYFQALEAQDDTTRTRRLKAHATAMKNHIRTLGNKAYWKQFERTPEVVVMFVPTEACLAAAFQEDPRMLEFGLEQHVLIATPVTLYGLLKAIAYGWQQQSIAENAREIAREGHQLCERMGTFLDHFAKTGKSLEGAVRAYNEAVGSAENRLMPSARRLRELGATTREPPAPTLIENHPRETTTAAG